MLAGKSTLAPERKKKSRFDDAHSGFSEMPVQPTSGFSESSGFSEKQGSSGFTEAPPTTGFSESRFTEASVAPEPPKHVLYKIPAPPPMHSAPAYQPAAYTECYPPHLPRQSSRFTD
eukprot:TRINITY_DN3278_c0_g1_i1.p2 TRINITY_DN3278_c0_g1~~TRINITY_DN3278_c0_g1_i1.p2  ORF type:complete len:117 (+),score=17.81 TRINITY_DN3278_c0_g1_i1:707-1057(+)